MWSLAVLSFVLGYIALLLIGSLECFQGTFVERWQYALTDGLCDVLEWAGTMEGTEPRSSLVKSDIFLQFFTQWNPPATNTLCVVYCRLTIQKLFGDRGTRLLETTAQTCCQGSNPIGQIFFAILFIGSYAGAHMGIFPLIDGVEVSTWHKWVYYIFV